MRNYTLKPVVVGNSIDYSELNPQQLKAVTHTEGPELVIAGAGTGKTRTLVYRVAHLVEKGVLPSSILLLTFTKKAAQEMMRRASLILDSRCAEVCGGTFHSFANMILRKYCENLGYSPNFTIADRSDSEDIVGTIRAEQGFSDKEKRFPKKKTIMDVISKSSNTGRSRRDILYDEYPQFSEFDDDIDCIAEEYIIHKKAAHIMDYDDLLLNLRKLLSENENIRKKLSAEYRYIMIDEYQDTNALQDDIGRLLCSEHNNIMVVGDDSQSIYSFRGADFRNIMDFPKKYPDCKVITIEENYRSIQPVLDFANAVIESAPEKYTKNLFSNIEGKILPGFVKVKNGTEQSQFICQRILELYEEGIPLSEIAVLFRSGWHSNELEIALKRANIPYAKYGGIKFAESSHVKDVVAHMRVIFNPLDSVAWYRVLELIEGIGPKTAGKIAAEIMQNGISILVEKKKSKYAPSLVRLHEVLSNVPENFSLIMNQILDYYIPVMKIKYDDYFKRMNDIESVMEISSRYETIERFLSDMSLDSMDDSGSESPDDSAEKVSLSTIHSAKGLEWNTVFIINLIEGQIPSYHSLENPDSIEEERRLFYVAVTRAKRNLYLIKPELSYSVRSYGSGYDFAQTSRFLTGIPDFSDFVEQWNVGYGNMEDW